MSNHVHFLMKVEEVTLGEIVKRITISYASYYNKKYDRVGHVFQNRFRSESVKTGEYLLKVLRYIYQNPQKAGICKAEKYPYTFIDTKRIAKDYFDSEDERWEFLLKKNNDKCMEYDKKIVLRDDNAIGILSELIESENPFYIQKLSKEQRDMALKEMKIRGCSIRQISRITGINRNIVQRA